MARYVYLTRGRWRSGVLRSVLQLTIYYEAPQRLTLDRIPQVHRQLLEANPDMCSVKVENARGHASDDSESDEDDAYERAHYGSVRITVRQLTNDRQRVRQNQFIQRSPLNR